MTLFVHNLPMREPTDEEMSRRIGYDPELGKFTREKMLKDDPKAVISDKKKIIVRKGDQQNEP